jgi:hypothetical protein
MRLPPYARELADARKLGLVPALPGGYFLVALGWSASRYAPSQNRYPRVVLPLDVAIQDYDLRPLAGLDLMLIYEASDSGRVQEVADCLVAIRPRTLTSFAITNGEMVAGTWHDWHERGQTLVGGRAHGA